jgi:PKD domain
MTISTENSRPRADAGPAQSANVGVSVALDGSNSSDVDGNALTYKWSFVSLPAGSGAVLSDPAAIHPAFTLDESGTYVVQLTVNDGMLDSLPATVSISTLNSRPVAAAGAAQTVYAGESVQLDGSRNPKPRPNPPLSPPILK